MSIIKQIKVEYNDLKPGQKKIADYFLNIDFEGLNGTIEEIAEDIGTSELQFHDSAKDLVLTVSESLKSRFLVIWSMNRSRCYPSLIKMIHRD